MVSWRGSASERRGRTPPLIIIIRSDHAAIAWAYLLLASLIVAYRHADRLSVGLRTGGGRRRGRGGQRRDAIGLHANLIAQRASGEPLLQHIHVAFHVFEVLLRGTAFNVRREQVHVIWGRGGRWGRRRERRRLHAVAVWQLLLLLLLERVQVLNIGRDWVVLMDYDHWISSRRLNTDCLQNWTFLIENKIF